MVAAGGSANNHGANSHIFRDDGRLRYGCTLLPSPAMVVGSSAIFFLYGSDMVMLVPKAMFAALLFTTGLNLLSDNLRTAYSDLQAREFVLVVMHIGLTAVLGMLAAVVLGMLFTATIFIVQYSSHSGVLQSATSLLERSKVARTVAEQEVLEQYGATVLIIHLHGMIFFGSANSVLEEVKAHLATLAELQLPLRFLLLDFDRCSAIDSSAVGVLFQTRRSIRDAGLIFACASGEVLAMLNKAKQQEFEHFTTVDLALERCENQLLLRYGPEGGVEFSPPSPVMLKSQIQLPFGKGVVGRDGLPLPMAMRGEVGGGQELAAIDERHTYENPDDLPAMSGHPHPDDLLASSDDLDVENGGGGGGGGVNGGGGGGHGGNGCTCGGGYPSAAPAMAPATRDPQAAPSVMAPSEQKELRRQRKRMLRDGRATTSGDRAQRERLPNPFVGLPPSSAQSTTSYSAYAGPATMWSFNSSSHSYSPPPGVDGKIQHHHRRTGSGGLRDGQQQQTAQGDVPERTTNSGDDSSDSSAGGAAGLATIYSPEQARNELRPEARSRMRDRFTEAMRESYGAKELEELFEYFDILLVPPNFTVVSSANQASYVPSDGTQPPYLYVLDRGNVSSYATLGATLGDEGDEEQQGDGRGGEQSIGAELNASLSRSQGETNPRHRLAKYGPGAILGVAGFVTPSEMPDLNIMPTAAISDTYCQLLRLPRSRCDDLEHTNPALIFRLYRLLVLISERRLQDHRMRVVASEAFKINVRPSTGFQRMLAGTHSSSTDQLPQVEGGDRGGGSERSTPRESRSMIAGAPSEERLGGGRTRGGMLDHSSRHANSNKEESGDEKKIGREYQYSPNDHSESDGGADATRRPGSSTGGGGGGPILQGLQGGGGGEAADASTFSSREISPNATPIPSRADASYAGPTLNPFTLLSSNAEPLPPSQSFPGREALPVANLMSYQSAMLEQVSAEREAEREAEGNNNDGDGKEGSHHGGHRGDNDGGREAGDRSQDREKSPRGWRGSFLWPTAVDPFGSRRQNN